MDALETAIMDAHRSGNRAELERLQARFRDEERGGLRTVVRDGPPPTLIEPTRAPATTNGTGGYKSPPLARRVVLTPSARDAIRNFYHGDGIEETGGALLGMIAGPSILVNLATEWARAERGRDFIAYEDDEIAQLEEVHRQPVCGAWHLHPGQPDPKPSNQDRRCWGRNAGRIGHPWATIILGDNGGVYRPMKAYITHFGGGRPRTVPAPLLVEER